MKLKKLLAFGLALVMCLAMAACGTNPDEKTDAKPVSITVTENWDFSVGFYPVITPMVSSTYGAGFWSRNFYNTLVSYDDNGKIQGELAETWEISDDGKTYTFHLRDGVKFSDGTPLTSEAVKMTLEAVVTNLGPQNGAFGKLTTLFDKLETPDEKTFVMTLKTPYYAALDNLTMALPLQREVKPALLNACAMRWKQLQQENAPLRIYLNGKLQSASENIYDSFILREVDEQADEFSEANLIGNVLGKNQLGIGDAWIALRMEKFIKEGMFTIVTTPSADDLIYHRTLRKCP